MMTAEGLQELHGELTVLEGDGRREIAERIKTAREWGDLKENSEYHDAKNEQAHLETKIARLREKIANAVVVEEEVAGAGGVVGFGSTVVVRDPEGVEQTWRIVSSHDAAPGAGRAARRARTSSGCGRRAARPGAAPACAARACVARSASPAACVSPSRSASVPGRARPAPPGRGLRRAVPRACPLGAPAGAGARRAGERRASPPRSAGPWRVCATRAWCV